MKSLFNMSKTIGVRAGNCGDKQILYNVFAKGKSHPACVFTIGCAIRKEMRWINGDRVDVLYDEEMAEGQIIRCKEGGWAITDGEKETTPVRIRIGYHKEYGLPLVDSAVDLAYDTTDNTVAFAFPIKFRQPKKVETKKDEPNEQKKR